MREAAESPADDASPHEDSLHRSASELPEHAQRRQSRHSGVALHFEPPGLIVYLVSGAAGVRPPERIHQLEVHRERTAIERDVAGNACVEAAVTRRSTR